MAGIIYILLSCVFFSVFNCVVKILGHSISSYNIAFFRALFSLLTLCPFLFFIKFNFRKEFSSFIHYNIARVVLAFAGTYCFAAGMKGTTLNESVAITFVTPILTSLMAIFWLKDKPSIEKWIAISIGLAGVTIILNPNVDSFNYYSLYILGACVIWASSSIIMKILSKDLAPLLMVFYVSLLTTMVAMPYFLYNPYIPSKQELIILFAMGALHNLAQILMIKAYQMTKLSVVAPFDFMRLVLGAVFGYLFFNEVISDRTIIGAIMIICGCTLIVGKEQKSFGKKN